MIYSVPLKEEGHSKKRNFAVITVSNLTQYKLFIGDDKKYAFWSDLLL